MSSDAHKDTKEFVLTGGALDGMGGSRRRRGATTRRKQKGGEVLQDAPAMAAAALKQLGPNAIQKGGDNSGALMQLSASESVVGPMNTARLESEYRTIAATALGKLGPNSIQRGGDLTSGVIQLRASEAPTLPGAPSPVGVVSGVAVEQPAPVGGARVVLKAPKRKTRIALKAKKLRGGSESVEKGNMPPGAQLMGGFTRKIRKIQLRVKGVTNRLKKAKNAKKQAMLAPIGAIRTKLESAGVIKKGSKAPEQMMRNMYADLLITKKGL
jgi:hypothetical protein